MNPIIRVAVADDHPAVLSGVKHELSLNSSILVDGFARNSTELIELLDRNRFEVLVCDYAMPCDNLGDGIALFSLIQQRHPYLKIVVLTMMSNPTILAALISLDIHCVVSKSDLTSHLSLAVYAAYANGRYLSPTMEQIVRRVEPGGRNARPQTKLTNRELEVVRLFISGMTITGIAARLNRSKKTISTQKSTAMTKLNIHCEVDLLRYGIETGLLPYASTTIDQGMMNLRAVVAPQAESQMAGEADILDN